MDRRDVMKLSGLAAAGLFAPPTVAQDKTGLQLLIDYIANADAVADRLGYTDPALRPAYHQHVMMILSTAYIQVFGAHVQSPDWLPYLPYYLPVGGPNADDIYRFTSMDARGTYRLHGVKGNGVLSVLTMKKGGATVGKPGPGKTLVEIELNDVAADQDGKYSFILSAERPAGYTGAWYALHPETTQLMWRSRTKNLTQRDPTCIVERTDTAPAPSFPTAAEAEEKLKRMYSFASAQNEFHLKYLNGVRERGGDKGFLDDDQSNFGALVTQKYLMNVFDLGKDEALVIETEIPKTFKYWSVNLFDGHFNAIDYTIRQSALNDEQVRLDKDGRVRIVVANADPGVHNWLDFGGWPKGGMLWRWNSASSYPIPTIKKVKFKDVHKSLPKDTPKIAAAERREILDKRAVYQKTRGR